MYGSVEQAFVGRDKPSLKTAAKEANQTRTAPRKNDNISLLVMDADMQGEGEEDTCGLACNRQCVVFSPGNQSNRNKL